MTSESTTPGKSLFESQIANAGAAPQKATDVSPTDELNALPLHHLIGAPLIACNHAQFEAATAVVNFMQLAFFNPAQSGSDAWGTPRYVQFTYTKTNPMGQTVPNVLKVPLMTMCPVPNIRISEATIDFLCKIGTIETYNNGIMQAQAQKQDMLNASTKETETETAGGGTDNTVQSSLGPVSAMKVDQRKSEQGTNITKDYSYSIKVKAVSDETPPGIEKLLDILNAIVKDTADNSATYSSVLGKSLQMPNMTNFSFGGGGAGGGGATGGGATGGGGGGP